MSSYVDKLKRASGALRGSNPASYNEKLQMASNQFRAGTSSSPIGSKASYAPGTSPFESALDDQMARESPEYKAAMAKEAGGSSSPDGRNGRPRGKNRRGEDPMGSTASAMPDKATALRQSGFGGLAEAEDMKKGPLGSTSSLSGPGSRRAIGSSARSLERLARRYSKMEGGAQAASSLLTNAANIRMNEPSLRSEAGIQADQAFDSAESSLVDDLLRRRIDEPSGMSRKPLTRGGRSLRGYGRPVGGKSFEE